MKDKLLDIFKQKFGDFGDIRAYFAPGRVNLIGEHTDYNGGHVFPCALTIGTYAVARKRDDDKLRFYSMNFEEIGIIETSVDNLKNEEKDNWANYSKGVIWALQNEGYKITSGFDVAICGTIPNGSGLSSSASLEVLTCFICQDLYDIDIDMIKNALIGQKAENDFIGVNCGIMDQFAIAMGKKDSAIFLDTSDLSFEYAPVVLKDSNIVILNTNKKRGLGDSKYNERRSECEKALEKIKTVTDINSLGDLTVEKFNELKSVINDEILIKRAKHAVSENERTVKAVEALNANDLKTFGELMIKSHESLRDDYEVTGIELDTIVNEALKQEGVIGARMTGAGFGGCGVAIVKSENTNDFINNVGNAYKNIIGYDASFYVVNIGDGPVKF
ncbi:galactokinase [uncultured Eubacterium sp.]|uniref:galactokinase n=1 Tax=uncultured Eubacterium sp. TaxID=165185 RepID=UPI000E9E9E81|nr:galactokinase [uncultured Eubacterium sp.]HAH17681.1 galactokinase [Eubacterium sp.]HAV90482.1 galactokinase [Eubacterium sp.]